VATLEFEVISASLSIAHGTGTPSPFLQLKLKYSGSLPLLNTDGELLQYENWWLMVTPPDADHGEYEQADPIGTVRRISRQLISADATLPVSQISALIASLLASKPIKQVDFEVDGLEEIEAGFMWRSPDSEALSVASLDISIPLLPPRSDA
jgi:hypothetical protein